MMEQSKKQRSREKLWIGFVNDYYRVEQYPVFYRMEITNILPTETKYGLN